MRKNLIIATLTVCSVLALAACGDKNQTQTQVQGVIERQSQNTQQSGGTGTQVAGNNGNVSSSNSADNNANKNSTDTNILVAYFTVPETDGVDTVAGASRVVKDGKVVGNTEYIASEIQKNLGADIFNIKTASDYPGTHSALLDYAYKEKSANARPELSTHIDNLDKYSYIIICYPNWNADLPMPLYTFFDEYDFSGKTIIPVVTHGGSGFSGTINTIKKLEPGATVTDSGLSISRNDVAGAASDVKAWTDALLK